MAARPPCKRIALSAIVAFSFLFLLGAPRLSAQTPSFSGFKPSGIGYTNAGSQTNTANQVSVATGHFRGTNEPLDLAVADAANETVEIWFGNGDGTFQRPTSAEIYTLPPLTSLYSGAPPPSVEPTVISTTGNTQIAAADLSGGNGVEDVVLANFQGPGTITLLKNNRGANAGTFTATLIPAVVNSQNYVTNRGGSIAIAIGDFNGDGYPDLAIGNADANYATGAACSMTATCTVSIVFNNAGNLGAYNFGTPVSYNAGIQTVGIAAAPLRGTNTSTEDLVVTDGESVYVLLNNGSGTNFTTSSAIAVDTSTFQAISGLIVSDVNHDGFPDVIVEDQFATDMSVLINKSGSPGTLQSPSASLPANFAAVAGAFNSSSPYPGLVLLGSGGMLFLPNTAGTGTFGSPVVIGPYSTSSGAGTALAAGEFNSNNDMNLDVVAVNGSELRVVLGNGDGTFQIAPSYLESVANPAEVAASPLGNFSTSIAAVAVGNLHGSGAMDTVTADIGSANTNHPNAMNSLIVRLANSNGTLPPSGTTVIYQAPASSEISVISIVLGNFGGRGLSLGNGAQDIAAVLSGGPNSSTDALIYIFQNNGSGLFKVSNNSPIDTRFTYLAGAVAGNFRGGVDGNTDIAAIGPLTNANNFFNVPETGSVVVILGNGDGTFQQNGGGGFGTQYTGTLNTSTQLSSYVNPAQLAVGSLIASKYPDIVVADSGETYPTSAGGGVWVLKNSGLGDGSFNPTPQIVAATSSVGGGRTAGPSSIALGPIFGTSLNDIVASSSPGAGQFLDVIENNGSYTFTLLLSATYALGGQVAVADVNQDGKPDVVLLSDIVQALLNTTGYPTAMASSGILFPWDPSNSVGPIATLPAMGPQPSLLGLGYLAGSPTVPNVLVGDAQPAVDVLLNSALGGSIANPNISASVNPTSLSFGLQIDSVGAIPGLLIPAAPGSPLTVTLTNTSTAGSLTEIIPTVTGTNAADFSLKPSGTCGTALSPGTLTGPGGNCTISVTFAPSVVGGGPETATLSIADNANASPEPQTLSLSGTGVPFLMTSSLTTLATILQGGTGTLTFNVTLGAGTGTLLLSCAPLQALVPDSTCTLSPSSIPETTSMQTVQVTATFTTTSPTTGAVFPDQRPKLPPVAMPRWLPLSLIAAILLLSLWMCLAAAPRRRAIGAWAFLALIMLCGGWMAACSAGNSGGSSPPATTSTGSTATATPTPQGSYTFVVTGKLGSVTQTINLTLNVN